MGENGIGYRCLAHHISGHLEAHLIHHKALELALYLLAAGKEHGVHAHAVAHGALGLRHALFVHGILAGNHSKKIAVGGRGHAGLVAEVGQNIVANLHFLHKVPFDTARGGAKRAGSHSHIYFSHLGRSNTLLKATYDAAQHGAHLFHVAHLAVAHPFEKRLLFHGLDGDYAFVAYLPQSAFHLGAADFNCYNIFFFHIYGFLISFFVDESPFAGACAGFSPGIGRSVSIFLPGMA